MFYQSDFDYDIETLNQAAGGSHFLWLSRANGTSLLNERDVYIRNTSAHQTWCYYSAELDGVKAFAVMVRYGGDKPVGDIYELDYSKHKKEVQEVSHHAKTADITFKPTHTQPETMRRFDIVDYNELGSAITQRYGNVESLKYSIADKIQLQRQLSDIRRQRKVETFSADINDYVREMVKERFHKYGYTRDDMTFCAPEDAFEALKHGIPVSILYPDNTAEPVRTQYDVDEAVCEKRLLGMDERDKRLLNFFKAGNTLADLPFTHAELTTIFHMALDRGKECIADPAQRENIDSIIKIIDTALFDDNDNDEITHEQDYEFQESEGYEP